jgi:DNA-binding response OmpR family regulator
VLPARTQEGFNMGSDLAMDESAPAPQVLLGLGDADRRRSIATALRNDGFDVLEAHDGGRLLVCIASAYGTNDGRDAYDLVVLETRLAVCSGMQILEGLRRAHWTTPVIMLSAREDGVRSARAESLGAVVVEEPLDIDELQRTVRQLLGRESHGRSSGVRRVARSTDGLAGRSPHRDVLPRGR